MRQEREHGGGSGSQVEGKAKTNVISGNKTTSRSINSRLHLVGYLPLLYFPFVAHNKAFPTIFAPPVEALGEWSVEKWSSVCSSVLNLP